MTGAAATQMSISPQAQALLDNFASQAGVSSDHVGNLTATINASPALTGQFNKAVAAGHLGQFQALPAHINAGDDCNSATQPMRLPLAMLASPASGLRCNAAEAFAPGPRVAAWFQCRRFAAVSARFRPAGAGHQPCPGRDGDGSAAFEL